MKKNLVEIIKANPGCKAVVDNDQWHLYRAMPNPPPDDWDEWYDENELASSDDDFDPPLGDGGYGSGNSYGGDLLQACAIIAGMKVESV